MSTFQLPRELLPGAAHEPSQYHQRERHTLSQLASVSVADGSCLDSANQIDIHHTYQRNLPHLRFVTLLPPMIDWLGISRTTRFNRTQGCTTAFTEQIRESKASPSVSAYGVNFPSLYHCCTHGAKEPLFLFERSRKLIKPKLLYGGPSRVRPASYFCSIYMY